MMTRYLYPTPPPASETDSRSSVSPGPVKQYWVPHRTLGLLHRGESDARPGIQRPQHPRGRGDGAYM
jgi:hypothetical protein